MLEWIKKRVKEPTTYIGAGLLAQSVMVLTKADPAHTDALGSIAIQVAEPLADGNFNMALTLGLGGILGMIMGEKGSK